MKTMPWQDIYPLSDWKALIEEYKQGKIKSKARTTAHHIQRLFNFGKFKLPKTVSEISDLVERYHGIEKRSIEALPTRAALLRMIAAYGQMFLARHTVPTKGAEKSTLDYAISKLVRRATRKSAYVEKLRTHLKSEERGFTTRDNLLDYIQSRSETSTNRDLVPLQPGSIMERVDPWHRGFELKISRTSHLPMWGGESIYGFAFIQWMRDKTSDLPFFVWLEGHWICTGIATDRTKQFMDCHGHAEVQGSVEYNRSDLELSSSVRALYCEGGQVWAFHLTDEMQVDLFDTKDATGKGIIKIEEDDPPVRAYAYVWSRDEVIFAANHVAGGFHHSSFVGGKKVRCAGMISVRGGKVVWIDNNSGHYQPSPFHLKNFVSHLNNAGVFSPQAQVKDESGSAGEDPISVADFLAIGQKPKRPSSFRRPELWSCPECGRRFVKANERHRCVSEQVVLA